MSGKRSLHYRVVDIFTRIPLQGNPLAVFSDAAGIDDLLDMEPQLLSAGNPTVFIALKIAVRWTVPYWIPMVPLF